MVDFFRKEKKKRVFSTAVCKKKKQLKSKFKKGVEKRCFEKNPFKLFLNDKS